MCASRLSNIMCASHLACVSTSVAAGHEPTNHEKTRNQQLCNLHPFLSWLFHGHSKQNHIPSMIREKKEPRHSSLEVVLVRSDSGDDHDHSFGHLSRDKAKTCPESLSDRRKKLAQCTKENKVDRCISFWSLATWKQETS